MKNTTTTVILIIILTIGITGTGVRSYYKSTEKALIAAYDLQLRKNEAQIANYEIENEAYKQRIKEDSIAIAKKSAEILKLKNQTVALNNELITAKQAIKDFTAGEAINYLVDYAQATDSRMLVNGSDTSLVITTESVKKIDNIFAEHKVWKLEVPTLNQIIAKQDGVIITINSDLSLYKKILDNKDKALLLADANCKLNTEKIQLQSDKYKTQRNRLRWGIIGTSAVVVGSIVLKSYVTK